jgi:hypothetical protein
LSLLSFYEDHPTLAYRIGYGGGTLMIKQWFGSNRFPMNDTLVGAVSYNGWVAAYK